MRERTKQIGSKPLSVRLWTLKDKQSAFRASEPDRHCVELLCHNEKNIVMLRDWWFDKPQDATNHYNHLIDLLK